MWFIVVCIAGVLLGLGAVAWVRSFAPEGWEDETGFHYGRRPGPAPLATRRPVGGETKVAAVASGKRVAGPAISGRD